MDKLIEFLRQALPVQVTLLIVFFAYLLWLIKQIAEKYIGVAEKQAILADSQAKYVQDRLLTVEKALGITDKAIDLRDKHITELEALNIKREKTITDSEASLRDSESRLAEMERQYRDAMQAMGLKDSQIEELKGAQTSVLDATREAMFFRMQNEFRAPLVAVRNNAIFLRRRNQVVSREQLDGKLQDIEFEADILMHKLHLLELISVADLGEPSAPVPAIRIHDNILKTINNLTPLVRQSGLDSSSISCDLQALRSNLLLRADPSWISHVIYNLFTNAVNAAETPTSFKIEIRAKDRPESCIIEFEDSGIGIPEGAETHIFDKGFRGSNQVRRTMGAGLGLTISHRLMRAQSGDLTLSHARHPTIFEITIAKSLARE